MRTGLRSRLLRGTGWLAYAGLLVLVFAGSAYYAFSLFVRSGVTRAPDLSALSRDAAESTLADAGLVWVEPKAGGQHSELVAEGLVLSQRPQAGRLVKRGSSVEVTFSLGPRRLTVPNLEGQSIPAAQEALAQAGLLLGRTLSIHRKEASPGAILEQRPEATSPIAPGSSVDILVATPMDQELYLMPELVYRSYESVRRFFEGRGFRFESVRSEPYEGIAEGVILQQLPAAGSPISRRDPISLVVAARARLR